MECKKNKLNLHKLIVESQSGNKESLEQLCILFDPLLKSYTYRLNSGKDYKDTYNNFITVLINCIQKIPISEQNFINNKYILSYFKSSIKNAFIQYSISYKKYTSSILLIENYNLLDMSINNFNSNNIDDYLLLLDIKDMMSEDEYNIIRLKITKNYTSIEIANKLGISRQTLYKRINKIKSKLKDYFKQ